METVRVPSLLEHQMENHFDVSGPHEVSLSRSPTVASALYCQCSAGCQQRFHREWPPEVSVWPLPRWCLCLHRGAAPSENPLHSTRSWTPQPKLHPHPDLKCSVNIGSQCCKSKCTHQGMKYKVGSMECVCVCVFIPSTNTAMCALNCWCLHVKTPNTVFVFGIFWGVLPCQLYLLETTTLRIPDVVKNRKTCSELTMGSEA